jgi:hypothetical protein
MNHSNHDQIIDAAQRETDELSKVWTCGGIANAI